LIRDLVIEGSQGVTIPRHDLTLEQLGPFISRFYASVLADPELAPFFATIDLPAHLPHIVSFWAMALFGAAAHRRDLMSPHIKLHAMHPISRRHFDRWLHHFNSALDTHHAGPKVEEARTRAASIAAVMLHRSEQG
jgi:hemoglobin